jgi:uncharacterized heparinase superfamily protein
MTARAGEGLARRIERRALNALSALPPYRLTLGRSAPATLAAAPIDPWPGEPGRADLLFRGHFHFAGKTAEAPNQPPWRLLPREDEWLRALHGFAWLRDFAAAGGPTAQAHARRLVRSWIELCGEWDPLIWAPEVQGRRLLAWVGHAGFLLEGAEPAFREAFLVSLVRQLRHLLRAARLADGEEALLAAVGTVAAASALGDARRLDRGLDLLARAIGRQIAGDGGHVSRRPEAQMQALRDLVAAREAVRAAGRETPDALQNAIDRMGPMLRALRHGDGGLALFNGGFEASAEAADLTLARADARGKALDNAPHTGFQRLAARKTVVIADAGTGGEHAGCLAFELSVGKRRIVVNCGSGRWRGGGWAAAARATAAHSTLTVDDTSSAPTAVQVERQSDETGCAWLDLAHDGYLANLGLRHRRRLYLDASGADLRGEDALDGDGLRRNAGRRFALRFHLHPEMQASLVQGGGHVLLKPSAGPGWRFRASGGEVALEESVYLGRPEEIRRTWQIVVSGPLAPDMPSIKWAFRQG